MYEYLNPEVFEAESDYRRESLKNLAGGASVGGEVAAQSGVTGAMTACRRIGSAVVAWLAS